MYIRRFVSFLSKRIFNKESVLIFNDLKDKHSLDMNTRLSQQVIKLKKVVKLIKTIPNYEGVSIDCNNLSYSEFQKLPILTKDVIRNVGKGLINLDYKYNDYIKSTSGGSTGEPLEFYITKEQQYHGAANYYYANYLNNVNIYARSADLWGAERDMNNSDTKTFDLKSFMHNKITLNTFVMSETIYCKYIERLNSTKPNFIKAYVHSVYDLSKYINRHNIKVTFKPVIHCTTGPLYPEMREEISKAFNDAYVYNFYGSREVSAIATQVFDSEGLYVLSDNVFVELLDENNEQVGMGEEGEIVITTLNNFYMPLLRYRIGDRAIKGDDLEFGTLLLHSIVGRTLGVIYTHDGRKIDGQFFTTLFFDKKGISNFQLIQKSLDKLQLKIVKNKYWESSEIALILERINQEIPNIEIDVVFFDKIDLTVTGKRMYVYSEIAS